MKKTMITLALTGLFSSTVMAAEISPPMANNPTQPIEIEKPVNPIEPTPSHPIESEKPVNPIEPTPSHPIEEQPVHPDLPMNPTQPIEQTPTQPIEQTPTLPIEPDVDPDFGLPPKSGDSARIDTLEKNFTAFAEDTQRRFAEVDEQMDGIRAGLHAVTNARPFVTSGEFAMGAAVGFAGSKEAVAIGGAYGINSQLSVSGTFHYENSGKYSSSDVAGGVGVQYSFK